MGILRAFLKDECGAVTVDWVALTAGIMLLGIATVYTVLEEGVTPAVDGINERLDSFEFPNLNLPSNE